MLSDLEECDNDSLNESYVDETDPSGNTKCLWAIRGCVFGCKFGLLVLQ